MDKRKLKLDENEIEIAVDKNGNNLSHYKNVIYVKYNKLFPKRNDASVERKGKVGVT